MGRKRYRLVPQEGIEAFEIRQVLYLDPDGRPMVDFDVDKPDHSGGEDVAVHEVLGVMLYSALMMVLDHLGYDVFEPDATKGEAPDGEEPKAEDPG